jgi:hypothetical protein
MGVACLCSAPSLSHASAFGGDADAEREKYKEILELLHEPDASVIEGDFLRLVVFGWGEAPVSLTMIGNDAEAHIFWSESRRVPFIDGELKLVSTFDSLMIDGGPPPSMIYSKTKTEGFFSKPFVTKAECFHPNRYWVEARIGEEHNIIARGCDRLSEDGAPAVEVLIKAAIPLLCYENLVGVPFPGFPMRELQRKQNE